MIRGDAHPTPSITDHLRRHARAAPDRLALCAVDDHGQPIDLWTFAKLANATDHLAAALHRQFNPGDVVGLWCENCTDQVAWILGGLAAGVRLCLLHPLLTPREVNASLARCRAKAIISATPHDGDLPTIPLSLARERTSSQSSLNERGSIILLSSGTTGTPKLARRDDASLVADGVSLAAATLLSADDRMLAAVPLSHSYGVDLVMAAVSSGASLHIRKAGFDGGALHRYLAAGHITVVPGVPLLFAALARESLTAPPKGVRLAFSAGSPCPPRVCQDVERQWGVRLGHLYGATELGTVAFVGPDHHLYTEDSVGVAVEHAKFRIVDPADSSRHLPDGTEGEIAVCAPSMLCEYLDGPMPMVDGFFLTGDLGRIDREGRIYITGRLKHIIDTGGLKVNPVEVETVYLQHPAIADCALVGLPLSDTVTKLALLIVPRDARCPLNSADLRQHGRQQLAPFKIPRVFSSVEMLPRSTSGKLLRHQLPSP